MKHVKRLLGMFLMVLAFNMITALQVMAADMPTDIDAAMAQLRLEDEGPDLSLGELISEVWGVEEEGIPYVERCYLRYSDDMSKAVRYPTRVKRKSYGARGYVEIEGSFRADDVRQTVNVIRESGHYQSTGGSKMIANYGITRSGDGTKKVTITYSCKVDPQLGSPFTAKVSMSCDYKGTIR